MRARSLSPRAIRFGHFVADLRAGELRRDGAKIKLQEQPFKILAMLLERSGDVVTREEMQEKLWPGDTFVDFDHGINMAVAKIRVVLADPSEQPRYIETVGKRGYRFVAAVVTPEEEAGLASAAFPFRQGRAAKRHSVGRENELSELKEGFRCVEDGKGLLLCVAGEAGIGKTTLVEDFLADLVLAGKRCTIGRGKCSERLAGAEAYLPVLEALESMCHGKAGGGVTRVMRRLAPTWYGQIVPRAAGSSGDEAANPETRATSQERLKRELFGFLRELSQTRPLVLFLDDMQWADISTVDLLAYIGGKFHATRVLIVVTYRPSELLPAKHPFLHVRLDLQMRGVCRELEVGFLSRKDIESYLQIVFPGHRFPTEFPALIHAKTEGNALYMVDVLRYLRTRKVVAKKDGQWELVEAIPALERELPESVRSMILRKIEQLDEADRGLLVAASVQGYEFESAVAAKVLRKEASGVEERLVALDRMYGFVRPVGDLEYPDKTYTLRYRFLHVLYQNALYDSLGPTRRAEMSIATAEALISFYRHQVAPVASQLAFLFETGRDYWRACEYFLIAAHNAEQVFAHDEVIALTRHGLDLLRSLPETPLRARRGLDLQLTLAFALSFAKGYAAPETAREMTRTLEICREMGETAELVPVFWALWTYYIVAGNLAEARRTGEQILRIAEKTNDPVLLLAGHTGLGISLEQEGDFALAHEQLERGVALHDPGQTNRYLALYRMDPGMLCRGVSIRIFSLLGYAEKACHRAEESLQLAKRKADPSGTMLLLVFAAHLHQFLQNAEKARKFAEECMSLCNEYGNPTEEAWVTTARGWAEARDGQTEEGLQEIRKGLTAMRTVGAEIAVPLHFSVLADAARVTGRVEEGLAAVEGGLAIARKNGDHFYDAELLRLKGEMLLVQSATNAEEAEACFQQAIETSRRQTAKGLELRASTSLARLWQAQGKGKEAQQLLGEIYAWFTEGFSTADLREAAALLQELI